MIVCDSKSFHVTIQNTLDKTLFIHSTIWISLATTNFKPGRGRSEEIFIPVGIFSSSVRPRRTVGHTLGRDPPSWTPRWSAHWWVFPQIPPACVEEEPTGNKSPFPLRPQDCSNHIRLAESCKPSANDPSSRNFSCTKTVLTDLFLRVCSHTLTTPTISLVVRRNSCIRAATRRAEDGKEAQWGHIRGYLY